MYSGYVGNIAKVFGRQPSETETSLFALFMVYFDEQKLLIF